MKLSETSKQIFFPISVILLTLTNLSFATLVYADNKAIASLKLYYSPSRKDNFTAATPNGVRSAVESGYRFVRVEGYIYKNQWHQDLVPLKLFWHHDRRDNFTTATAIGERSAIESGYRYAHTLGYVWKIKKPNTIPLKLYYSRGRTDNFTTATDRGERSAVESGYNFARVEGYIPMDKQSALSGPESPSATPPRATNQNVTRSDTGVSRSVEIARAKAFRRTDPISGNRYYELVMYVKNKSPNSYNVYGYLEMDGFAQSYRTAVKQLQGGRNTRIKFDLRSHDWNKLQSQTTIARLFVMGTDEQQLSGYELELHRP